MAVSVAARASSRRYSVVELKVVAAAGDDDVGGDDVGFVLFDVDDVADVAAVAGLLIFYFSLI